jgi:hypothetical protein
MATKLWTELSHRQLLERAENAGAISLRHFKLCGHVLGARGVRPLLQGARTGIGGYRAARIKRKFTTNGGCQI